jgi:hypothetical protein
MTFKPCPTHSKEDLRPRDFDPRPCSSKYTECHICKKSACWSRFYQCSKCGLIGAACHSSEPPYFWKSKEEESQKQQLQQETDPENNFDDIITSIDEQQEQKQTEDNQKSNPLDAYFATRFKLSFLC